MKPHTKIYFNALGYSLVESEKEFRPCEITGKQSNDIHHIEARGMGGDPTQSKDRIENLMAVTRKIHIKYGDKPQHMAFLFQKHLEFLETKGVEYDRAYMYAKIDYYNSINDAA